MKTGPFDTQKVKAELKTELLDVEQKAKAADVETAIELAARIRWLIEKIRFLESPEYERRKQLTR